MGDNKVVVGEEFFDMGGKCLLNRVVQAVPLYTIRTYFIPSSISE